MQLNKSENIELFIFNNLHVLYPTYDTDISRNDINFDEKIFLSNVGWRNFKINKIINSDIESKFVVYNLIYDYIDKFIFLPNNCNIGLVYLDDSLELISTEISRYSISNSKHYNGAYLRCKINYNKKDDIEKFINDHKDKIIIVISFKENLDIDFIVIDRYKNNIKSIEVDYWTLGTTGTAGTTGISGVAGVSGTSGNPTNSTSKNIRTTSTTIPPYVNINQPNTPHPVMNSPPKVKKKLKEKIINILEEMNILN